MVVDPVVFSSIDFLLYFLPAFLAAYYLCPKRHRNLCLFLFSIGFYTYGVWNSPEHLVLLLLSLLMNYAVGRLLERHRSKALLALGLVYDFGVLFYYKYSGFVLNAAGKALGLGCEFAQPALPIGISFYTFQAASYLIDIYRRTVPAEHRFFNFGTYIAMFPQLIAGPIVRYQDIYRSLQKRRSTISLFTEGIGKFILGLGLKVLLANRIGNLWQTVCGIGFESISTPFAWMGILACSLQLYFDFWGYSLMAIGLGQLIGFRLPVNFRHPYQARSMTEFWRRWHITLGTWFREYVYIPLGGNRGGKWKTYRNLLIVWVLTVVWHGAGWNFLLWGFFLFAVIAMEKAGLLKLLRKAPLFSHVYMLLLIPLSWLLFSVSDLKELAIYLQRLVGLGGCAVFQGDYLKYAGQYGFLLVGGVLLCTPLPYYVWNKVKKPWATVVVLAVILLSCLCYLFMGMNDPFLYFRF